MGDQLENEVEETLKSLDNRSKTEVPHHLYDMTWQRVQRADQHYTALIIKWAAVAILVLGNGWSIYQYHSYQKVDQYQLTQDFINEYALSQDIIYTDYLNQAP